MMPSPTTLWTFRHRATDAPRSVRAGFTLLELLVVIAIITILLVIVAVSWNKITSERIEFNAINIVQGAARAARARAMELDTDVAVIFDQTGQGAIYRFAPYDDPAFDLDLALAIEKGLGSGPDPFIRNNLFVRDPSIRVGTLAEDVKLARMSSVAPLPSATPSATPIQVNLLAPEFQVAFCFDPAGRLRVRPIVALLPSVELNATMVSGGTNVSTQVYGLGQNFMSEVGCVGFRGEMLTASVVLPAPFSAVQAWLQADEVGATLVVNRWTGRRLPGPEAG